ncbi:hypothetical protein FA15DRAFT_663715 [Coprinopsis marcescibilis]|uniref:DNA polymerase delta subunit 4 n=1 Tax=Coprinopsis marcescibilis TaxID=230819 RepID=A0A5C3LC89_COPMA|nr:hypothetical protein FA15DRAFT_663715 [Coprinopsis marcescibilis]
MSGMKQSTLSFGASKSSAAASQVKKATTPSSTTNRNHRKQSSIEVESSEEEESEQSFEDIEDLSSEEESKDEIESAEDVKPQRRPVTRQSTAKTSKTAEAKASSSKPAVEKVQKKAKIEVESEPAPTEANDDVPQSPLKLDIKNPAYKKLYAETRRKMDHTPPIHSKGMNKVEEILRTFDLNYDYGPCVGITRLKRWERANALGLNPPSEIYDILNTKEGLSDPKYSKDVLTSLV